MNSKKIFLVHGWTYSLAKWDSLISELKARGFEPVLLKVPGLSQPSDEVWNVEKYVEWLRGKVGQEEDLIIGGQSNGGRMIMAYDVKYPGQIKHMFLIASSGIYHDSKKLSLKRKVFKFIAKLLKPFLKGVTRRVMYRLIGAPDYGNAKPNMRETMKNVTEYDKTFDITKVSAPTTLIWGEKDYATPLEDAHKIKDRLQNPGELHVFEGVKHSPQGSKPVEVAEIMKSTIEGLS